MSPLWTSAEAAAATQGANTQQWTASGVSIDSRTLEPGDLFIAIRGPNMDGHDYVADAFAKGAAAAMVDESRPPDTDAPLLRVCDTEAGMRRLAHAARRRSRAKIAAITGSAGKTGTKDSLALVLSKQGRTASTKGNLNNHWGVPLSLARLDRAAEFGVFELGMNSPGEISPLSRLTEPDIAVVTNVEAVHIGYFNSEAEIADAKAEIFDGLSRGGTAILNRDNRHFRRLHHHAKAKGVRRIRSFGAHAKADVRLIDATLEPDRSQVKAHIGGRMISYDLGAPGRHWVTNSLAVLAAAEALGADIEMAAASLAEISPAVGRGARRVIRLQDKSFTLIDESYNANPASMRAALAVLGAAPGRRIAVLGDMLELGAQAPLLHAALAEDITSLGIEQVFLAGRDMANLAAALDPAIIAGQGPDSDSIVSLVRRAVRPGDTVMVKGSLGSRMAPIVAALAALDDEALSPATAASEG